MSLSAGTKLGSYEVFAPIGAGGMGEVYQAHDTKLGRDVAIKVLPEAFAHDPERLSARSQDAGGAQSSQHRYDLWPRAVQRHEPSGDGVGAGRDAGGKNQTGW